MPFVEAVREKLRLKMLIAGPTDSGKTATGLMICTELCRHYGGRFAVIDTEDGRCRHYLGTEWAPDGFLYEDLQIRTTDAYRASIMDAEKMGVTAVLVDGITPAWSGDGGLLDKSAEKGGHFSVWNELGKEQRRFLRTQTKSSIHVIATCRMKTDWQILTSQDAKTGKTKIEPVIVGTELDQRKSIEYEYDIFGIMDRFHYMHVMKATSCATLSGKVFQPTTDTARSIIEWLDTGKNPDIGERAIMLATPEQLHRLYKLYELVGFSEDRVNQEFFKRNGKKPTEVTATFMEEKLEELTNKINASR